MARRWQMATMMAQSRSGNGRRAHVVDRESRLARARPPLGRRVMAMRQWFWFSMVLASQALGPALASAGDPTSWENVAAWHAELPSEGPYPGKLMPVCL